MFITMVLPQDCNILSLQPILKSFGKTFVPLKNASVQSQLLPGEQYGLTKKGDCDCGTCMGVYGNEKSEHDKNENLLTYEKRKIEKLQKKGWGASKINRWLEENRAATHRQQQRSEEIRQTNLKEATNWVKLFQAVVSSNQVSSCGVLLHHYHGRVDRENILLQSKKYLSVKVLVPEDILLFQEDILYWIGG